MTALIKKIIDFLKFITNRDWNGAATQAIVWIAGVVVVMLYAQTDWAETFGFAGILLSDMNLASQIAIGLGFGSVASFGADWIKARDHTDSAAMPPLFKP